MRGIVTGLNGVHQEGSRNVGGRVQRGHSDGARGEERVVRAEITDAVGDVVAKVAVTWHLSPKDEGE